MNMHTHSLCPVCLTRIEAHYVQEGDSVYLEKHCDNHGAFKARVWKGTPTLEAWLREEENTPPHRAHTASRLGCPYDCGVCGAHEQAACCVIFDVTNECDLRCPICFADAGADTGAPSLARISKLYDVLLADSPGRPFNIQLSGGEPSQRKDIVDIVRMGKQKGFPYIQLNTNGLRLADDKNFAGQLKEAGLDSVFLQFDGVNDSIYTVLRGRPLLEKKLRAIRSCAAAGLGIVFVMVVTPMVNADAVGTVLEFAMKNMPTVRGVHFQPVSYMGRNRKQPEDGDRMSIPELLTAIEAQTEGRMRAADFIPLTSGHCLCSFHGNFLVDGGNVTPISSENTEGFCPCRRDAITRARSYIANRWKTAEVEDAAAEDWELFARHTVEKGFSITAMAFQDVWTLDLNRLKKCRVHTAVQDGRMLPLCAYNITSIHGERLYGRI